ncbi:MAG: hypothetical protein EOP20_01105 [Hyphomicrobiales bacterium]|nr:MAG: hypothetical protein EOP20_01105 [Hyphomicrobiales bacterium]
MSEPTIMSFYPPIGLATVINVFCFAAAWRGHVHEKRSGTPPWWMILGILAYLAVLGSFFYFKGTSPLRTHLDLLLVAVAGQAMGALAVFAVWNVFNGERQRTRAATAYAVFVAFTLMAVLSAGLFT